MEQSLSEIVMAKGETIIMRVDAETKRLIEEAAQSRGLSVTSFVTDAALSAASKSAQSPPRYKTRGRLNVPHEFEVLCREAARGGAFGFVRAGRYLFRHAVKSRYGEATLSILGAKPNGTGFDHKVEPGVFDEAFARDLQQLLAAIDARDEVLVLDWFDVHYSSAMDRVSKRRRSQFYQGVIEAADEQNEIADILRLELGEYKGPKVIRRKRK